MLRPHRNNKNKHRREKRPFILSFLAIVLAIGLVLPGLSFFLLQEKASAATAVSSPAECRAIGGVWRTAGGGGGTLVDDGASYCTISPNPYAASSKGLDWQIQSYIYYQALGRCLKEANFKNSYSDAGGNFGTDGVGMSHENAINGNWFADPGLGSVGLTVGVSPYMRTILGSSYRHDSYKGGSVACSDESFIVTALNHWGYSPIEALCAFDFKRESFSGNTCFTSADGGYWYGSNNRETRLAKFQSAIKNRVYAGQEPTMTQDYVLYAYYRQVFQQSCLRGSKDAIPTSMPTSQFNNYTDKDTYGYSIYDVVGGIMPDAKTNYIGDLSRDTKVLLLKTSIGDFTESGQEERQTCSWLEGKVNDLATVYARYVANNPDSERPYVEDINREVSSSASSCPIEGIGWIACPLINAGAALNDTLYGWVEGVLVMNPLEMQEADGTATKQYDTWKAIRDIANVLLVIAFLIIIFSQLTSRGIDNYGIKKMLPRIILVAVAINLSYFAMMVMIDVANIVGNGLHDIVTSLAPNFSAADIDFANAWSSLIAGIVGGTIAIGTTVAVAAVAANDAGTFMLLAIPFVAVAVLSLLAAVATLFLRNALVIVLAMIAPLAFAAYLLPNTEEWFKKWRKLFVSMLMLYPMAALLFGGAKFAAYVMIQSNQPLSILIAVFVMVAPLGMLPWLAKSSGGILATVSGKLQSLAKSAKSPLQKTVQPFADSRRAKYREGAKNWFGRTRGGDPATRRRTLAQRVEHGRMRREKDIQGSKDELEAQLGDRALNPNAGNRDDQKTKSIFDRAREQGEHKRSTGAAEEARTKQLRSRPGVIGGYQQQFEQHESAGSAAEGITKARLAERILRGGQPGASPADRRLYRESQTRRLAESQTGRDENLLKISHLGDQGIAGEATRTAMRDTEVSSAQAETIETNLKAQAEQENVPAFVALKAAQQAKELASGGTGQIVAEAAAGTDEGRLAAEEAGVNSDTINTLQAQAQEKANTEFSTGVATRAGIGKRAESILEGTTTTPANIGGDAAEIQFQAQAQSEKSRLFSEAVERQMTLDSEPDRFVVSYAGRDASGRRIPAKIISGAPRGSDHVDRLRAYADDPVGSGLTPEQVFASIKALGVMGGGQDMLAVYTDILPMFNSDSPLVADGRLPGDAKGLAGDIRSSIQQTLSTKGSVLAFNGPRIAHALSGDVDPAMEFLKYAADGTAFNAAAMASERFHPSSKKYLLDKLEEIKPMEGDSDEAKQQRKLLRDARANVQKVIAEIDRVPQYQADTAVYRDQLQKVADLPPIPPEPESSPDQPASPDQPPTPSP